MRPPVVGGAALWGSSEFGKYDARPIPTAHRTGSRSAAAISPRCSRVPASRPAAARRGARSTPVNPSGCYRSTGRSARGRGARSRPVSARGCYRSTAGRSATRRGACSTPVSPSGCYGSTPGRSARSSLARRQQHRSD